jgi:hypothetical protein
MYDAKSSFDCMKEMVNLEMVEKKFKCLKSVCLEVESFSGGVEEPGVVVRALEAGVQAEGLSGQLSRGQGAGVWQRAVGLTLHIAFVLPFGVITEGSDVHGVLHPLDNLKLGNKVDITLSGKFISDPFLENLRESLVNLKPTGVEAQTEWGPVGAVMSLEVVFEEAFELSRFVQV